MRKISSMQILLPKVSFEPGALSSKKNLLPSSIKCIGGRGEKNNSSMQYFIAEGMLLSPEHNCSQT